MERENPSASDSNNDGGVGSSSGSQDVVDEKLEPLRPTRSAAHDVWMFHMRPADDDDPEDWWFASTAIPLLAATTGPLANVLSIAALVTSWRSDYNEQDPGVDAMSVGFPDPRWCIGLNAFSLVCGFAGNAFLLLNFTKRVRYIVALPMTIIFWYFATAVLMAILISMNKYVPPGPGQVYSQGFWHAVIAAVLYLVSSMLLMINMLGYFLGHYSQHFDLTDEQRNLILQTLLFFIWLAGGGGVFARTAGWSYADSLYFCDVTILTVGFGDFYAPNDVSRGLVFPYSVGGIIILGLMVSSIRTFAQELGHYKIIKSHVEKRRAKTMELSASNSFEFERKQTILDNMEQPPVNQRKISSPFNLHPRAVTFDAAKKGEAPGSTDERPDSKDTAPRSSADRPRSRASFKPVPVTRQLTHRVRALRRAGTRKPKLIMMREEKDRFDAMRKIQQETTHFKQYFALTMSVIAFGLLWCVGAAVFFQAERSQQDMTYFRALYFCYVSLLTIGYGDYAPKSNVGKPFFIVWSLIAVPTMTILISDMGDTVIASFKRGTFALADFTVLPKEGVWRAFVDNHPMLLRWLQKRAEKQAEKQRVTEGFRVGPADEDPAARTPSLAELAEEDLDEHDLAKKLAIAIRYTADHLKDDNQKAYTYEQWAEYTRLIRFSRLTPGELKAEEEEIGLIDWDWIGENSPMMAEQTECEWVLDRLCESLDRYMRRLVPEEVKQRKKGGAGAGELSRDGGASTGLSGSRDGNSYPSGSRMGTSRRESGTVSVVSAGGRRRRRRIKTADGLAQLKKMRWGSRGGGV